MQPTELLKEGQSLRRHDRAESIACFEESIQRAESVNDEMLISNALTELAIELIEIGQTTALGRAKSLLNRSTYLLDKLDIDQSLSNSIQSVNQIAVTKQQKTHIVYAQGLLSLQEGNFREAIAQFERISKNYADDQEMSATLNQSLAEAYIALGDFKTCLSYLEIPTSIAQKGNNYEQLGRINLHLDRYALAKDYFERSLDIALENDDKYLRIQAFIGLSQVAIAEEQWENAVTVIKEVISELEEPLDLHLSAYLYLNLAEAKLGMGKMLEAQEYVENYAIPRFEKLQNQHGLACGKRTLARILSCSLSKGMDEISEESIEAIADEFLEALIIFEKYGIPQEKAKTLYDLSYLYTLCHESRNRYQFQGKAVRSLEQALTILEQLRDDSPALVSKIEISLNELMGGFVFL